MAEFDIPNQVPEFIDWLAIRISELKVSRFHEFGAMGPAIEIRKRAHETEEKKA